MPVWKKLLAATAAILSVSAANAATVNVGATGLFGEKTMTTAESAPGQTFTFSFIVPDPVSGVTETNLTNPMYSLSGKAIGPTITSVTFHDASDNGLFDLTFSDNNVLSLYGSNIYTNGFLQSGFYFAAIGQNGGAPVGSGGVSVSVSVSPVPLPASAPLFGGAVLALATAGAAFRRLQRAQAHTA